MFIAIWKIPVLLATFHQMQTYTFLNTVYLLWLEYSFYEV